MIMYMLRKNPHSMASHGRLAAACLCAFMSLFDVCIHNVNLISPLCTAGLSCYDGEARWQSFMNGAWHPFMMSSADL